VCGTQWTQSKAGAVTASEASCVPQSRVDPSVWCLVWWRSVDPSVKFIIPRKWARRSCVTPSCSLERNSMGRNGTVCPTVEQARSVKRQPYYWSNNHTMYIRSKIYETRLAWGRSCQSSGACSQRDLHGRAIHVLLGKGLFHAVISLQLFNTLYQWIILKKSVLAFIISNFITDCIKIKTAVISL
jgi:hypothetical protein